MGICSAKVGRVVVFAAAGFLMAVTSQQAHAQRPAHYYPARPTFSPYILYRQINFTGVPNYYSFVQPAQKYRDYLVNTQSAAATTRQTLANEAEFAKVLAAQLRQRPNTGIGAPSIPAQYGNLSHFYAVPAQRRR